MKDILVKRSYICYNSLKKNRNKKFLTPATMMKVKLCLVFFCICMMSKINAQKIVFSKVKFGFKTGLSLSSFTKDVSVFDKTIASNQFSNYSSYEKYFRITSLIGIVAKYPVTPSFSWGAELLYGGRGAAYRQKNKSVTIITSQGATNAYNYYKFNINYLEVPITANYNLSANSDGKMNFWIYGGLVPAIAGDKKTTYLSYTSNDGSPLANSTMVEGKLGGVRPFNISTIAGFEITGKREQGFFVNARISEALLPVFQDNTSMEGYNMKTGMWTFTLGLGLYFHK